jgi:hypothetical protein
MAKNNANKNVIIIIQGDNGTLPTIDPANNLKTKPIAIIKISTSEICLSFNEYAIFRQKYIESTMKSSRQYKKELISEIRANIRNKVLANKILTSPLAKGLFFFVGCCLSSSISTKSLKI